VYRLEIDFLIVDFRNGYIEAVVTVRDGVYYQLRAGKIKAELTGYLLHEVVKKRDSLRRVYVDGVYVYVPLFKVMERNRHPKDIVRDFLDFQTRDPS
jgi:hypothetical protein